jgi:hypothetical protein
MRLLNIGETIKKGDEVNIQPFGQHNGLWKPIWEKVDCYIGWKVTESTYGKYRRKIIENENTNS